MMLLMLNHPAIHLSFQVILPIKKLKTKKNRNVKIIHTTNFN